MDISKKTDRAPLKGYFSKNAVPNAGNFADLIDGMISIRRKTESRSWPASR